MVFRFLLTTLTLLVLSLLAPASENAALAVALADLRTLSAEERLVSRYVWITDGEDWSARVVALTGGYITQHPVPHRPVPIGGFQVKALGKNFPKLPLLLRFDLRQLTVTDKQLSELIRVWEEFQFDPRLNLLVTRDTLKFAAGIGLDPANLPKKRKSTWVLEDLPEPVVQDGKRYTQKWVEKISEVPAGEADVVRLVGPHIDPALISELIDLTQSQAPVVNHRYFVARTLATIKTKNPVYSTIFGGLYYELAGVPLANAEQKKQGITDLDVLFESLGVAGNGSKIKAFDLLAKLNSDQKIAMYASEVTGKPRMVFFAPILSVKPTVAQGFITITFDVKVENIDIAKHAMANLGGFEPDALEVLWVGPSGVQRAALYDGKGNLQEAAPSDVVGDRTVPAPYSTDLQAPISCIVCHGPERGWRYAPNHALEVAAGKRPDILNDFKLAKGLSQREATERLKSQYSGDLEQVFFPRARDDYDRALLATAGPWDKVKILNLSKITSEKISATFHGYRHRKVDAAEALADLGIPPGKDAHETLSKYMPPVGPLQADGANVFKAEDFRFAGLKNPKVKGIVRTDYDLFYAFMARRVQLVLAAQAQEKR
jgi:hypothetical protein